jgi:MFS superfamily sulfate permease-like transporter
MHDATTSTPQRTGLTAFLKSDILSGFLVFLIALPLCLAIAKASGFPPIAGVFTAIVGGLICPWLSNSELTIKGPAAGLIVIVLGAMLEFGFTEGKDSAADLQAYRMVLAIGVAAGILQLLFGLLRTGILGEFFPSSAVHGLLAAIGVIIIAKQVPVALGVSSRGEPLELLMKIPEEIRDMNPEIALIGGASLLILFLLPLIKNQVLRRIPAPMIVLLVAVPLGMWFDLSHEHTYSLMGHTYKVNESFLLNVPQQVLTAVTSPDFSVLARPAAWKWVVMFALIGSLESLLSAKAIDLLDPFKRKTSLNQDLVAIGLANTLSAAIGGLPMISEIVRSRANLDNGGRTRLANAFHGMFLTGAIVFLPSLIHRIPLAALAAMLVYTGFRLASPREFFHVYRVGREQLVVFVSTLVAVLATDLLLGIGIGIGVKLLIHFINGVPLKSLFLANADVEPWDETTTLIKARESAVFSNWILFKRRIENYGLLQNMNVIVDLSETELVDHTVMEKLHDLQRDFEAKGLTLDVVGLENHFALSPHPHAARRRTGTVADSSRPSPGEPEPVSARH